MATIKRTYKIISKEDLANITPVNGQVIALYDTDAVYYDAPTDGTVSGAPKRRKISGVEVVTTAALPTNPMTDIIYVCPMAETLPDGATALYECRIWDGENWKVVGSNRLDENVKSNNPTNTPKFYLVGTTDKDDGSIGTLVKKSSDDEHAIYAYVDENSGESIIHADKFAGVVANADYANSAGTAQKAVKDENDQDLISYVHSITDVTPDPYEKGTGSKLMVTLGNGNASTITTKDTTYPLFSSSADGIVPKTNPPIQQDDTHLLLTGSGWINTNNLVLPHATSADNDGNNHNIADTYGASLIFNDTTRKLSLVNGNGTAMQSTEVTISDSKYDVFSVNTDGLVPGPTSGETTKFLRGDANWATVPNYTGATSVAAGIAGLVPPAQSGHTGDYLKGDGTWGSTFTTSSAGLVPTAPNVVNNDAYSLKANGTWSEEVRNTAGSNPDTDKLFVIGAKSQADSAQTYSNTNVFIENGKLYQTSDLEGQDAFIGDGTTDVFELSTAVATAITEVKINNVTVSTTDYTLDSSQTPNQLVFNTAPNDGDSIEVTYSILPNVQVVDQTSAQALQNKTYEGYTLGEACSRNIVDSISTQDTLTDQDNFTGDGTTTEFRLSNSNVISITEVTVNDVVLSSGYDLDVETPGVAYIIFDTAPATPSDPDDPDNIIVTYTIPNSAYNPDLVPTVGAVKDYVDDNISTVSDAITDRILDSVLAPVYDETHSYQVKDFCTYKTDSVVELYRCHTATSGDFDPTKWTKMTIIDAIKDLITNP